MDFKFFGYFMFVFFVALVFTSLYFAGNLQNIVTTIDNVNTNFFAKIPVELKFVAQIIFLALLINFFRTWTD